jgi:hypothetical protein
MYMTMATHELSTSTILATNYQNSSQSRMDGINKKYNFPISKTRKYTRTLQRKLFSALRHIFKLVFAPTAETRRRSLDTQSYVLPIATSSCLTKAFVYLKVKDLRMWRRADKSFLYYRPNYQVPNHVIFTCLPLLEGTG